MRRRFGHPSGQVAMLLAFVLLCGVWAVVQLQATTPGCDGERYLNAGRAMALGQDPYVRSGGYIYPPFLAWSLQLLALDRHPWVWRVLVTSSAVVLLSAALALARLHRSRCVWLAAGLLLGQSFAGGIATGNAQLPVAALLALALLAVDREWHVTAGALCGLAAALKVTPALLIAFLAGRAVAARDRPAARAALASVMVAAATLLVPWTPRWLALTVQGTAAKERSLSGANLSWQAFAVQAGLALPALVPALLAFAATMVMARSLRLARLPALAIVVALALAGAPVAWGFAYLTLLPAIAVLWRELRQGHHFVGDTRGRDLLEYASVLAFTMVAVNADHFYLHEAWAGRHLFPLLPLLGTLLLAYALWRTQATAPTLPPRP